MKIVAAGGGSGGHVTPVIAVLRELKKYDPKLEAHFVTDKKFGQQAAKLVENSKLEVSVRQIVAGKFRRYHKLSIIKQILDLPTVLLNVLDAFLAGIGFLQSLWLLMRIKPDVVFCKGGFVCLPLGLAAAALKIPLVVHDSDAHAGLTNRIIARWATKIATGAPLENYNYPSARTYFVGIPVDGSFRPSSLTQQRHDKEALGLHDTIKPLVVITGGGLGAQNINRAVVAVAPRLLNSVALLHITGTSLYESVKATAPEHVDYLIKPFVSTGMARVFSAADIVVARAGMSTLFELAAMAKPVIIVPNPLLTGGHQLKNAAVYKKANAAIVLDENELVCDPTILEQAIKDLLKNTRKRQQLGQALYKFAKPDASMDMAALIVDAATGNKKAHHKRIKKQVGG
jgi:UDP-N-acetylglucosamine--N-acetylmuramyl-(pentapeptide) pyrophosphoryl-undecaprenol N-acetylglucosamine transferase